MAKSMKNKISTISLIILISLVIFSCGFDDQAEIEFTVRVDDENSKLNTFETSSLFFYIVKAEEVSEKCFSNATTAVVTISGVHTVRHYFTSLDGEYPFTFVDDEVFIGTVDVGSSKESEQLASLPGDVDYISLGFTDDFALSVDQIKVTGLSVEGDFSTDGICNKALDDAGIDLGY